VLNGLPGWQEALRELLKNREVLIEPWVTRLTDEQLRFIIMEELPGWQRAYDELLIERYGDVIAAAARRFDPRAMGLERVEAELETEDEESEEKFGSRALGLERAEAAHDEAPSSALPRRKPAGEGKASPGSWTDNIHGELLLYLRGKEGRWGHLHSWDPKRGPFRPWLWKVVWNLCNDLVKREAQQRGKNTIPIDEPIELNDEEGISLGDLIPDPDADPEGKFIEDEMERLKRGCLRKSLAGLDPKDQRIIALSFFFGLTDGEIAEELGMARETVNRRKRAAIQKLNAYMNECLEGVL
jgi:RNA polymerase sigma factor (sigma-70 family)